jgi:polysaccharide biosynthesis protein PslG
LKLWKLIFGICIATTLVGLIFYICIKKGNDVNTSQNNVQTKHFSNNIPSGLGVSIHFTGNPIDVDLISDAGFKIVRTDLFWQSIEKEQGKYDFKGTGYDQLHDALLKNRIRPYYILDYSNKIYEENKSIVTKKGQDAFVRYVDKATSRYKNSGVIWEVWNEPNIGHWEPKPNYYDYSVLVKKVSKVIKKNDPSGIVVAPALAGITNESLIWLEEIFKQGTLDYIDAVSVHPYRASTPETAAKDYQSLRTLIKKYTKKKIKIISGEWGYSTANNWYGNASSERQQAEYLVRMYMVNLLSNVPISVWYGWKNDGLDPNNGEHNFGIIKNNLGLPKEAYLAINHFTYLLSGYNLVERIDNGDPNDYVLKFKDNEENIIMVLWTVDSNPKEFLPSPEVKGSIVSIFGENSGFINNENAGPIVITGSPKFIILDKKNKN